MAVQVSLVKSAGNRIGDRGPGDAARAGVADDDRVGQRLAGGDVAGRGVLMLEPPALSALGDRQVGQIVGVGRGLGCADRRRDGGRVRQRAGGRRTDRAGDRVGDRLSAGQVDAGWSMLPVPLAVKPVAATLPVLVAVQVSPVKSAGRSDR